MADEATTAETLGGYYRSLRANGIDGDLVEEIVRDAAQLVHRGEMVLTKKEKSDD